MSDATPRPDSAEPTTGEPVAAATPAAAVPVPGRLHLVGPRLWNRRTPLLLGGATLLLGCVLGAGVVAVGAFVVGDGHHRDDRSHSNSDQRGNDRSDNRGNDDEAGNDHHKRPTAPPSTPAAPPTVATPGASAGSPVPGSS